jgi:hypothetical protein
MTRETITGVLELEPDAHNHTVALSIHIKNYTICSSDYLL